LISITFIVSVGEMAYKQSFKKGLKFTNLSPITFLDNDWIAGVYQDEVQNENKMTK